MAKTLHPTLWRTCRMLANERRLGIIRLLIDKEPQTLTQLAKASKMSLSACSQYTRHITARGLCREVRRGRFAYFDLHADPAVEYADSLLKALIVSLKSPGQRAKVLISDLTAYTHVSRIKIVNHVFLNGVGRASEMQRGLHISEPALFRHINKLLARKVLELVEPGCYRLQKPKTFLAKELFQIATGQGSHTS